MLKCRDIATQASDYLDGNQTLRQRLAVALHLLICGNCKDFIRHLRLALAYYRRLPPHSLADAEATAITRHVLDRNHQHPQ
jgi:hypothetical protein